MKAQLPTDTRESKRYIDSDLWGAQQKLDGHRYLFTIKDGTVTTYNRNGVEKDSPLKPGHPIENLDGWFIDGELVGQEFYAFDGYKDGRWRTPYVDRYNQLLTLPLNVPTLVTTASEKQDLLNKIHEMGGEGIIFKKLDAPYRGGRNFNTFKFKFTKDVDCVVMELAINGKSNMVLGMYDNGVLKDIGKSSSLTGDGPRVKVGDVVKINCLYVGRNGRLYQPVLPRIRTDKLPEECLISQLDGLETNKEVAW